MGMFIYAWTLLVSFMVMTVHLYPQLTLTEILFASIPVGAIGGAWLFFLVCVLLNFLRCEPRNDRPSIFRRLRCVVRGISDSAAIF